LEALRSSIAWVWDLVLERADGTSSLAASLSSAVELIEDCIDVVAVNGVCWGTWSALPATVSHFPELGNEMELLGSEHNTDLMEDQLDALWNQARQASDSLASFVPPLVAHDSPYGAGE
jgi:hypothetical protein